jgi:hypothetical protein
MAFDLSKYSTAESAREAITEQLPKGTRRTEVLSFLDGAGISCFDPKAEILSCRVTEKSYTMVHVVWQLAFYFEWDELIDIQVTRGLVGP